MLRGVRTFANADCGFGYRTSRFKAEPGRHVVLDVTFQLRLGTLGSPLAVRRAGPHPQPRGRPAGALESVREAVLTLRSGKGMVLDPADHDTWSAGSFFTNPVLAAGRRPRRRAGLAAAGRLGQDERRLADRARRLRQGVRRRPVRLSTKHTLALTNRGGATTADLLALARELRDGVHAKFGITLVNEPVLVGVELSHRPLRRARASQLR